MNNLRTGTYLPHFQMIPYLVSFLALPLLQTIRPFGIPRATSSLTQSKPMILEVDSIMRFRTAVSIATLFLLCFAISLWSVPLPAELVPLRLVPEPSSVSGTIANVNTSQFTLSLNRNQNPNKLEFVVDANTKIEGQLAVGSHATVDYRAEGQQLVATHVVVLPASGIQLY
jgi:hypothetical protein